MIETMDCGEARISLGVYVLGAIDPAERALVDAHLATCRDCRDELAGLAGLPALLARVSAEEAAALAEDGLGEQQADGAGDARAADAGSADDGKPGKAIAITAAARLGQEPPRELLGTVLDLTAARRRRRNWRNAGLSAAAAVIIAAAAFGGGHLAASQGASSGTSAQGIPNFNYGTALTGWTTKAHTTAGMYASVTFRGMKWGTQLALKVVGIPVGTPCTLVVVGPGGTKTYAGSWVTDTAEGTVSYWGSAGVSAQAIQQFWIMVYRHPTIVVPA